MAFMRKANWVFANIRYTRDQFLVRLHGEYNTSLALRKYQVNLLLQSFKISIRKLGSANTAEDPSLRIESFAVINLRGVSTKLN